MSDAMGEPLPGLSMQEAADAMGVSVSTMRQWCATGRVRTEQVTRDAVHAIRVHLDQPSGTKQPLGKPTSSIDAPPDALRGHLETHVPNVEWHEAASENYEALASQQQATTTLALVSSTASQFLAPFVAELTATRELSERQARDLRDNAELIGRLSSDLDQARAAIDDLKTREAHSRTVAHRLSLMLVILGTLTVAAISAGAAWWFSH